VLSSSQILEINAAAGKSNAAATVSTQGWYLKVADPGPTARVARSSPVCVFFYADGGAVQVIDLSSIEVQ